MATDSEKLVKDWQEVLKHARQLELTLKKLVFFLHLSVRFFQANFHAFPRSAGFLRTSRRTILERVKWERVSNFTRYAARSIDFHTI